MCGVFFFKHKTAYEMRISDWSSDVCSSDLPYREIFRWWLRPLTIPKATFRQPRMFDGPAACRRAHPASTTAFRAAYGLLQSKRDFQLIDVRRIPNLAHFVLEIGRAHV